MDGQVAAMRSNIVNTAANSNSDDILKAEVLLTERKYFLARLAEFSGGRIEY